MTRRSWMMLAVIAAFAAAATLTAALAWRGSKARSFAEQDVVAVTLELAAPPSRRAAAGAEVSDPLVIRRLTQMLDRGAFADSHPCTGIGRLTLKRANGSRIAIEILPRHDADFVEYRYGGVYRRIRRADFFRAVAPFGVPVESFAGPAGE